MRVMATNRILAAGMAALLSMAAERAWAAGDTRLADAAMKRDTVTVRMLLERADSPDKLELLTERPLSDPPRRGPNGSFPRTPPRPRR